jgi:hypothetical protein
VCFPSFFGSLNPQELKSKKPARRPHGVPVPACSHLADRLRPLLSCPQIFRIDKTLPELSQGGLLPPSMDILHRIIDAPVLILTFSPDLRMIETMNQLQKCP